MTSSLFSGCRGYVRQDLHWLDNNGDLRGYLPLLGDGPHSFCSACFSRPPNKESIKTASSSDQFKEGLHVFFADGHGAICSVRLDGPP